MVTTYYLATHPEDDAGAVIINSQDVPLCILVRIYYSLALLRRRPCEAAALREYVNATGQYDVRSLLSETSNRWIIFASECDLAVPVENVRGMVRRLGERAVMYVLKGAGHGLSPSVSRTVYQFVTDNIAFLTQRR